MRSAKLFLAVTALAATAFAAGDAKAGKAAYDKACKSCHGPDGKANPAIAKMMKVEMRALGDAAVQALPDAKWTEIVSSGSGKMKPVKAVSGKSLEDVIAFCRTLKP